MAEKTGVGKPFNFDASAWLSTRPEGAVQPIAPIEEDELVQTARKRIGSLLQGELPEEVLKQVEIRAAEKANQGGFTGPMARNLTFRDLGASAMDGINMGIQASAQQEALRIDREKTNRALQLDHDRLVEETRQANDRFAAMIADSDMKASSLAMEAIKIQSANTQFRLAEENRLIMSNSQVEIPGLQQNMDTLGASMDPFNKSLQSFINLYT